MTPSERAPRNAILVYDDWYGATLRVAAAIAEGIASCGRVAITLRSVRATSGGELLDHGLLVLGGPSPSGAPSRALKGLVRTLGATNPRGRKVALYATGFARERSASIATLERWVRSSWPAGEIEGPGLSVVLESADGMPGRDALDRCRSFGARLGRIALRPDPSVTDAPTPAGFVRGTRWYPAPVSGRVGAGPASPRRVYEADRVVTTGWALLPGDRPGGGPTFP
jgi:hypothetical protein